VTSLLVGVAALAAGTAVLLSLPARPPSGARGRAPVPTSGSSAEAEAVRSRRSAGAVAVGVGVAVLLLAPGWLGLAAPPAAWLAWRRAGQLESAGARRRRERLEGELPHVVDLVRALVATGASPDRALQAVSSVVATEVRDELRPWAGRLLLGSDPVLVWSEMARHPQLGRLGTSLHRAATTGAPVTDSLQRLSDDLRSTRRADVQRRVRQVEVRSAAPLGACLLPAFVLIGVVPLVAGALQSLALG
jgi:Flp pilus assembly protein TadB